MSLIIHISRVEPEPVIEVCDTRRAERSSTSGNDEINASKSGGRDGVNR